MSVQYQMIGKEVERVNAAAGASGRVQRSTGRGRNCLRSTGRRGITPPDSNKACIWRRGKPFAPN